MRNVGVVRYRAAYGGIAVVAMWVAVRRAGGHMRAARLSVKKKRKKRAV